MSRSSGASARSAASIRIWRSRSSPGSRGNDSLQSRRRHLWVTGCCRGYVGITTAVPQIAPDSLHRPSWQSRARSCREQVQQILKKIPCHSITSSARASNEGGTAVRCSSGARSVKDPNSSVKFLWSENGNYGTGNKPGFPPRSGLIRPNFLSALSKACWRSAGARRR